MIIKTNRDPRWDHTSVSNVRPPPAPRSTLHLPELTGTPDPGIIDPSIDGSLRRSHRRVAGLPVQEE
jgi:hypothetical protein